MTAAEKTIAEHLAADLARRGVRHVFGLCGHTNIAVLAALENSPTEFVNVRHEQIAAHAADGYARVSGRASVVLSHLSPGLTNCATGVANAALDCVPMVVIAGDVPAHYAGKHPHQEVNLHADSSQHEIFRPFVKRAWRVERADLIAEVMEKAFLLAESGQPGPVLVSVPMDVFSKRDDGAGFARCAASGAAAKPALDDGAAREMIKMLGKAENPLIYAGGGILSARASKELQALVDHLQIPVAHTLMGKGALPDSHPLVLGMSGFWGNELTNRACRDADVILAVGARFKEADCSSWYPGITFNIPGAKLIHIDIEASEIGRNYPAAIAAIADAKSALAALLREAQRAFPEGVRRPGWREKIASARSEFAANNAAAAASDAFPMMPERILADTRAALPRNAFVTTDVGWNKNGVGQQFEATEPGSIITPGGFATMGFGAAAAIGVKLAAPERAVISLVGDGGFGQNPALLATAAEHRLGIVWLVMNNNAFGTIAGLQKAHYKTTYGTTFPGEVGARDLLPDYAALARAYGIRGHRLSSAAELLPLLKETIASGEPAVIDAAMINTPTPTTGHWNILDIYTPGGGASHEAT